MISVNRFLTSSLSLRLSRNTDSAITSRVRSLELLLSARFCRIFSNVMDSSRICSSSSDTAWSTASPAQMLLMFSAGTLSIMRRVVTTALTSCLARERRMSLTPGGWK